MTPRFDGESDPDEIEIAIEAQMATVDAGVTPFRLRNRYRSGVGTWIVSVAVPTGYQYDAEALNSAAQALGMRVEGFFEYSGDLQDAIWDDDLGEPPTKDGLPLTNEDQGCAFCGDQAPTWVHPLDPTKIAFRTANGTSTLPTFWTVCQRCEELVASGASDELALLSFQHEHDSLSEAQQVVEVFRTADLGPRAIIHVPIPD